MSRRAGIIISLVLALIVTVVINVSARSAYNEATQTVEVARAKEYIPVGALLTENNIEKVEIVASASAGMVSYEEALGKATSVSILPGQHIYVGALTDSRPPRKGYVEVLVDTTLARSAYAMPGERVNVHLLLGELRDNASYPYSYSYDDTKTREETVSQAPLILENILVLRTLAADGTDISSGDSGDLLGSLGGEVAVISLEIPEEHAEQVVYAAANGALYLTKVSVEDTYSGQNQ